MDSSLAQGAIPIKGCEDISHPMGIYRCNVHDWVKVAKFQYVKNKASSKRLFYSYVLITYTDIGCKITEKK